MRFPGIRPFNHMLASSGKYVDGDHGAKTTPVGRCLNKILGGKCYGFIFGNANVRTSLDAVI
jgi:hypothetical protein